MLNLGKIASMIWDLVISKQWSFGQSRKEIINIEGA